MGLLFYTSIYDPNVKQEGHELKWNLNQSAVTSSTDQEKWVSKIFIISLGNWIELERKPQSQAVYTLEYRPLLNHPTTAHLVPDRHNKINNIIIMKTVFQCVALLPWHFKHNGQ